MAKPKNILYVIPTLRVGGAEIDLIRRLPRMDPSRFRVTVCAFFERGELAENLTQAGIEVIGPLVPSRHKSRNVDARPLHLETFRASTKRLAAMSPIAGFTRNVIKKVISVLRFFRITLATGFVYLYSAYRLAQYIRRSNIDIIHTVLPSAYLLGALANGLAWWRPLIMSRVSLNYYHSFNPLYRVLERHFLHRVVGCAIGNSNAILKQLRGEGIPDSKLLLVHNGVDVAAFDKEMIAREQARSELNISPNCLVISSVANFFAYKGHQDLFKAMGLLRHCLPHDWALLLVGRDVDDNLANLCRLSRDLGLTQHIHFLHQRLDVPVILSAADIHVSASHTEGFPNNIIEAMCARLPVVATDVGGVPELVVHERTGLLVPAKNPPLMANAIRFLASNIDKRTAMGVAGRVRVEALCPIDNNVNAFQNLYARFATHGDRNRPAQSGPNEAGLAR